ncbi:MAG: carbohydrate-binding family 9-like protein [marine benthic group bacterium]|nr:carbohydrate-binding family 9-like protein [Gemmatimonadota bacterium]
MTATTLVLAACAVALSCDEAPRPVTTAAHLSDVPQPAIDWRPEVYAAPRAADAPVIDGALDDPAWQKAPWTADFVDIQGGSMPTPRYRTRARLLWNEEYLFIGAVMDEPHVWGTLTERDAVIYHDNDFEVFIDPDADTHLYYELEINALDTVWDLMLIKPYRDGGPAIDAWDIQGLRTGVEVDGTLNDPTDEDRGWSVEIAIPWTVLEEAAGRPVPPAPGDRWRFNFSRVQWRSEIVDGKYVKLADPGTGEPLDEDNWVWSPQGLIAMHYPEMWGIVEFVESESGEATSSLTESERALWTLRQVYYRQRERVADGGSWAGTAEELGLSSPVDTGLAWPPTVYLTPSGFEATLPLDDGRVAHIAEDGRTWVSD